MACEDGWLELIATLHREVRALAPDYALYEVSQKYGELYFRVDGLQGQLRETVTRRIEAAQARSLVTCESCGAAGILCRDRMGWLEVLCAEHQREDHVPAES